MWPLGSAICIWGYDVACGEKSRGTLGNNIIHCTFSVTFYRTTCQCIWGVQSQKPGTLCEGPHHMSLSLSLKLSLHLSLLCTESINSLFLLPTFGGRWGAVLAETLMPWQYGCQRMLLLTQQSLVIWGRSRPGPHLAWRDIFKVFFLSLGVSVPHVSLINSSTLSDCCDCGGKMSYRWAHLFHRNVMYGITILTWNFQM